MSYFAEKCSNCKNYNGNILVCESCVHYDPPITSTVFERITVSPEKLADNIVIEMEDFNEYDERRTWWESPIMQGHIYHTREEAYEATLARLKEVEVEVRSE